MQRQTHAYSHAASAVEEAGQRACGRQKEGKNKHNRLNEVVDVFRLLKQIGRKQRQDEKIGKVGQTAAEGLVERQFLRHGAEKDQGKKHRVSLHLLEPWRQTTFPPYRFRQRKQTRIPNFAHA